MKTVISDYEYDPFDDLISDKGATAYVFRAAIRNSKNSMVALKVSKDVITKGTETTDASLDKLKNEFDKIEKISHTNIINYKTITFLEETKAARPVITPVIVMEYASEGSLLDYLLSESFKKLDEATRFEVQGRLIRDMVSGLHYLHHEERIIHRDLKPGNILIAMHKQNKPIAKISDFGISKINLNADDESTVTLGIGTPHYMAPEQFGVSYGNLSFGTDLWALGVIIYWMFKGHVPFAPNADPERGKREVQNAILMEEPDCSDIPYPYQLIVKQCLIKKIDERITSTRDILKILDGDNESDYWNGLSIKAEKTVKDYIDYLKMFPRGKFREDAYNGILSMSQIQHKKAKPAPAQQHLMNLILTAVASALISYLIFQLTH